MIVLAPNYLLMTLVRVFVTWGVTPTLSFFLTIPIHVCRFNNTVVVPNNADAAPVPQHYHAGTVPCHPYTITPTLVLEHNHSMR
jgi:hypothetical protein